MTGVGGRGDSGSCDRQECGGGRSLLGCPRQRQQGKNMTGRVRETELASEVGGGFKRRWKLWKYHRKRKGGMGGGEGGRQAAKSLRRGKGLSVPP